VSLYISSHADLPTQVKSMATAASACVTALATALRVAYDQLSRNNTLATQDVWGPTAPVGDQSNNRTDSSVYRSRPSTTVK
jgi:hypothetical protein